MHMRLTQPPLGSEPNNHDATHRTSLPHLVERQKHVKLSWRAQGKVHPHDSARHSRHIRAVTLQRARHREHDRGRFEWEVQPGRVRENSKVVRVWWAGRHK